MAVEGVPRAAVRDVHGRHPLRDEVVEARHHVDRRVARHPARRGRDRGPLHHGVVRRRVHDQPPARGRHRRGRGGRPPKKGGGPPAPGTRGRPPPPPPPLPFGKTPKGGGAPGSPPP